MKSARVLLAAVAFIIFTSASAQQVIRGDICQSIPGLTGEQLQKIDQLGTTHQKKMDELRIQFRSENNAQAAASVKTQMNNEMQSHYQNVTALLTPEQLTWYTQTCKANTNKTGNYYANGYGRGKGRGMGPGRGAGYGTGRRAGYGAGRGAGYGAGRGRCRYAN